MTIKPQITIFTSQLPLFDKIRIPCYTPQNAHRYNLYYIMSSLQNIRDVKSSRPVEAKFCGLGLIGFGLGFVLASRPREELASFSCILASWPQ